MKHYEVRFGIECKRKLQEFGIRPVDAESYSDALKRFLEWANNGEQKFDFRKKPYKFTRYPVTEENVVSIVRVD